VGVASRALQSILGQANRDILIVGGSGLMLLLLLLMLSWHWRYL
jgi:hypothetical protein